MGLDIKAFKNLKVIKNPPYHEDEGELIEIQWTPGDSMKWSEKHFPGRGEGVNPDKVYTWEDSFSFCAGSYVDYGKWRSQLVKFIGSEGNAFRELINFADNEGVIGSVVSKKLAKDFKEYEDEARKFSVMVEDPLWFELYGEWKKAFELAAENGAVDFR
ncbi:hypothetical protein [Bacillus amyloliquefaciens]|uniref:hypothetical protein n=1 Tax=Bacillus amyloliquefaciens TaxID=1390 RepID=UPI001ABDC159|nr:hypothetical protein [Bacillus amyloliquefaciens]QTG87257.1 hypothetical protein J4048_21580 [Bacillus amyloliquefaciens]